MGTSLRPTTPVAPVTRIFDMENNLPIFCMQDAFRRDGAEAENPSPPAARGAQGGERNPLAPRLAGGEGKGEGGCYLAAQKEFSMRRLVTVALLLSPSLLFAADAPIPLRPVHTFSIVARDAATGELGVAVQSHA